ncbi:MAG TPA: hypothetical protein VFS43_38165 [Polyangiaceae bacterium]|nr:hypothetical protein [Polyangiaceae bacterium]
MWARTDGSQAGPFRNGMALRANDRLYFEAQVSKQANLYFFHCNGKQELERIPAQDAIVLPIGTRHDVPEPHAYFELDENPGADVIYVVASERTLEVADPAFNDAIERARHKQAQSLDCGKERFEAIAAGKPLKEGSTGQKGVRAKQTEAPPSPVKPGPPLAAGGRKSSVRQGPPLLAAANVPPPGQSRPWQEPVPADPMADTLRGTKWKGGAGLSASRADKDGIVVLRFSFTH